MACLVNSLDYYKEYKIMESKCNCHLCFHMVPNPPKPNVLCNSILFWRSMWIKCCCSIHPNCEFKEINPCECPKCCRCTNETSLIKNICENCSKKEYIYTPCLHQPYHTQLYCGKYIKMRKRKKNTFHFDATQEK